MDPHQDFSPLMGGLADVANATLTKVPRPPLSSNASEPVTQENLCLNQIRRAKISPRYSKNPI